MHDNAKGSLLMVGAMIGFTVNDAIIKVIGGHIPLFQMVFLRGIPATLFLLLLAWRMGILRVQAPVRDWALASLRAVMEVGAAYFFISALLRMELANVTAVLQVLPLSVALGAALVFREPLGWRRVLAILIGFCGVMLIVRPGPDGFTEQSIFALIAVALVTIRDLASRRMSKAMPSIMGAAIFGGSGPRRRIGQLVRALGRDELFRFRLSRRCRDCGCFGLSLLCYGHARGRDHFYRTVPLFGSDRGLDHRLPRVRRLAGRGDFAGRGHRRGNGAFHTVSRKRRASKASAVGIDLANAGVVDGKEVFDQGLVFFGHRLKIQSGDIRLLP